MRYYLELISFDIVGISETKLDDTFPVNQFSIDNYKLYRQDRNSKGGGVMMFVKDTIPHRIIKDLSGVIDNIDYISLEVTTQRGKWILTYIYCPPSVKDNCFTNFMSSLCENIISKNALTLFFGDLNYNLLNNNALSCICDIHGLTNLIKDPTCFKAENPTLLDVLLTDKPNCFSGKLNIDLGLSDFHNFVCVASKLFTPCESKRKIKYRSMKHFNVEDFSRDLEHTPFYVCSLFDDIDDVVWAHKALYESVLNDHAPTKSKTITNKSVPHMNSELRKAMNQRNMWRSRHFRCKSNKILRNNYVFWRNKVVSLNRCSIRKYFDEKCNTPNNSSSFFKTISPYVTDKKLTNGSNIILNENDEIVSDSFEVANIFNMYYQSIANYDGMSDSLCELELDEILDKHVSHSSIKLIKHHAIVTEDFDFDLLTEDKMMKYINNLNHKKAPGYDGFQSRLIKISASSISDSLCVIFNRCISDSHFPSDMKLSEISPMFKKNDSLDKQNYRSVNILTVLSKVFERILSDQLINYFKKILSPRLSAYRKGYSCQQVLLDLTELWRSALDENKYVGTISTDLSKAFDRMPHGLLVSKLHAYGLSSRACNLIISYLCDRKQRVKVQGTVSEWSIINRGVPQGSVLGPLLFNIFLNDLFYIDISSSISNYADDNNLCNTNISLDSLKSELVRDTIASLQWYNDNGLDANADKFQCVIMDRSGTLDVSIPVHDNCIVSADNIKILGVLLDSKLSFTPHVSLICKRASRQINALRRISKFLNVEGRLKVYKSFISANFSYCPVIWLFCGKTNSNKLEKLQERALRSVYNDRASSYDELLSRSDMLCLSVFRLRFLAIEVYKCVKHENAEYLDELIVKKSTMYNLRDTDLLKQPRFKTFKFGYRSFAYYGAKLWNSLPLEIKGSVNLRIFKNKLYHWCRSDSAKRLEVF